MFLPCQLAKIDQDYIQHKENVYYKKIVTILAKRIGRALKHHKHSTTVTITNPNSYQYKVISDINLEYIDAGYNCELGSVKNSSDKYIKITW